MKLDNLGAIIERTLREEILEQLFAEIGAVETLVDLGCGGRPYRHLYKNICRQSIGVELPDSPFPMEDIDIFCSATEVTQYIPPESVDAILCTEVLHDIAEPGDLFREVATLLRPGGYLLLTTPFMVPICDGDYDHYRFTPVALEYLCRQHGLEVCSIRNVANLFGTMLQFAAKPQLRIWHRLRRALGISQIYSCWNPFILLLVVLPQATYLAFHALSGRWRILERAAIPFHYGATGFVTFARKPATQT